MAVSTQLAVTSTAQRLAEAGGDGSLTLIRNIGSTDCYVGASSVTTGTGFKLAAGESLTIDLPSGEVLWAITASSGTLNALVLGST